MYVPTGGLPVSGGALRSTAPALPAALPERTVTTAR
jgi:hypothetical protein